MGNKKVKAIVGSTLLAAMTATACKSNGLDIRYQNISKVGEATIAYVKSKPYKHNLQEAGFVKYLDNARARKEDYLTGESLAIERQNLIDGKHTELLPTWDKFVSQKIDIFQNVSEAESKYKYNELHYFEVKDYSRVVFYLHGGAYFKNISEKHVMTCDEISRKFNAKVYMPFYPIAPANDANDCFRYIDQVYEYIVTKEKDKEIIIMGDSAGGGLAISYTQFLFKNRKDLPLPSARILFSPWCDVSMTNEQIPSLEDKDVFLSQYGLREIGKIWAASYSVIDYKVSPKYGEFKDKIPTIIFHGSDEILFPDAKLTAEKMAAAGTRVRLVVGKGLFHIYPNFIYTLPEAKEALDMAYDFVINKK